MPLSDKNSDKTSATVNVKSAARVLSIFEYFEKMRTPRTLSEISQDLDYPVSSALALLRSIHSMGYLIYDHQTKSYSPSIRFAMLGQWIHDRLFEGGTIIQMMEHLATLTQETVALGIQNGLQSQHVHIIESPQPLSYKPVAGTLRPLLRSAVGRALLSTQPEATVVKIVERVNALGVDGGRIFKVHDVVSDLADVRKDGFAYSANVFTPGAGIIAVALPLREGDVPMAISVSGPAARLDLVGIPTILKQIKKVTSDYLHTQKVK
jgi:IclR family KDG regulon transcriptional repressor